MRIIGAIKAATAYLHSPEVKKELERAIDVLDKELEDVGYVMSDDVELVVRDLEAMMDAYDEDIATARSKAKRAAVVSEEEDEEEEEGK